MGFFGWGPILNYRIFSQNCSLVNNESSSLQILTEILKDNDKKLMKQETSKILISKFFTKLFLNKVFMIEKGATVSS